MTSGRTWEREPLCVLGPGQVSLQLLERGALGATLGLETRTPTFHLSFFSFWPTAHHLPWCLGSPPRPRAAQPLYQLIGVGWSLPRMTHSQQWKEEPISQQCRGWGWRVGVVLRPIVWGR